MNLPNLIAIYEQNRNGAFSQLLKKSVVVKISYLAADRAMHVPYRDVFGDLHGELHGCSSHVDGAHGARPVHDLVVLGIVVFPVDVIELAEDVVDSQPLVHPLLYLK